MSATDELRRLLDERGVKWWKPDSPTANDERWTHWRSGEGALVTALEYGSGRVALSMVLKPEQAIAATLGNDGVGRTKNGVAERGTCEVDSTIKWDWDRCGPYWEHELSCGHTATTMEPEPPNFCPSCGAEVVE